MIAFMDQDPNAEGPYAPKPSITNITRMLDEGFLPGYYAKLVAEHAVRSLDVLARQVEQFGEAVAVGALKAIPSQQHANAAIGDEVHEALDDFSRGDVWEWDRFTTNTARDMFRQWLHFFAEEQPRIVASEFTVWSYKHGYAGSGDFMWHWRGQSWLVDTKTGNRVQPKVGMQCSALQKADVIITAQGEELPMPAVEKLGVFHLRPRSAKLYELQRTDEAFEAFLACKALFDWTRFWKNSTLPAAPLVRTEHRAS